MIFVIFGIQFDRIEYVSYYFIYYCGFCMDNNGKVDLVLKIVVYVKIVVVRVCSKVEKGFFIIIYFFVVCEWIICKVKQQGIGDQIEIV